METNATNVESAALWLFDMKFNHIVSIITRPLVYAISNHKSEGATIASNVLVDIRNAFSPRLTYVILS
jgi:hypothetical protein